MTDNRFIFGLNINARELRQDEQRVIDFHRRTKPSNVTVMHGPGLLRKLHDISEGQTVAILRDNYPDQNSWKDRNPRELVADWQQLNNMKDGFPQRHWYCLNEPIVNTPNELTTCLNWLRAVMEECANRNVKAIIGNFATAATVRKNWIDAGLFDDYLREISQWTNGGHGYASYHDYTWGVPPMAGSGNAKGDSTKGYWYWNMLRPELVQPDRWPDAYDMTERNWQNNDVFMRWVWLVKRAYHIGAHFKDAQGRVVPHYMVNTEGFLDRMPVWEVALNDPIEGSKVNLIPRLDQFARDNLGLRSQDYSGRSVDKLDGVMYQRFLYKWWYPQWTPERTYIEFMKWVKRVYPHYAQMSIFTASYNAIWDGRGHNILRWPELLDAIEAAADEIRNPDGTTQTPPPVEEPTEPETPPTEPPPPIVEVPGATPEQRAKIINACIMLAQEYESVSDHHRQIYIYEREIAEVYRQIAEHIQPLPSANGQKEKAS